MRLLIVEEDDAMLAFLRQGFEEEHYSVHTAPRLAEGKQEAASGQYDLVVLDWSQSAAADGEVLERLRGGSTRTPVIVLSSYRGVEERVRMLDLGADDYLAKPFAFSELAARARAVLRRRADGPEQVLRVEDLELDRIARTVRRDGREIDLTPKELALLEYLMQNAGHCVTRAMIIERVWKLSPDTISNVVDVYINYLRKKIDVGAAARLIHTRRGAGYVMGADPDGFRRDKAELLPAGASEPELGGVV